MKLKIILGFLLALSISSPGLSSPVSAAGDDAPGASLFGASSPSSNPQSEDASNASEPLEPLPSEYKPSEPPPVVSAPSPDGGLQIKSTTDHANAENMTWPVLPGESLNDVARMFYPKNKVMQKQFVSKTQSLNAAEKVIINPSASAKSAIMLVVPTQNSLMMDARAGKAKAKKSNKKKLQMSYNIKELVERVPASLIKEYENLISKNAFLKEELAKLHARLGVLQEKLSNLKLVLDKTFDFPAQALPANDDAGKKVFKNLSDNTPDAKKSETPLSVILQKPNNAAVDKPKFEELAEEQDPQKENVIFNELNKNLLIIAMLLVGLAALGSHLLRKYRQSMYEKFSLSTTKMEETQVNFGGYWVDTEHQGTAQDDTKAAPEQATNAAPAGTQAFLNTEARVMRSKADTILEEAKLLMSVNRSKDAIEHLKLSIDENPKVAINNWLYLLEIFRKVNMKTDFEAYAQSLHQTFNVMTPVWYQAGMASVAMVVPQHIEEFSHVVAKLCEEWPNESASEYLRSLITDNRDGIRAGFSKPVLDEILCLIALLETRNDFI